ncbi:Uncharacterised protein [Streptococcus equi subsp. equi]|nr:Uncharacterised protein [Streptococcus equi subsp. equi]
MVRTDNPDLRDLRVTLDVMEKMANLENLASAVRKDLKANVDLKDFLGPKVSLEFQGLRMKMEKMVLLDMTDNRGLKVKKGTLGNKAFQDLKGNLDVMVKMEKKASVESKDLKANVESKDLKANAGSKDLKANVGSKDLVEKILLLPQIQCHNQNHNQNHNQCLIQHLNQNPSQNLSRYLNQRLSLSQRQNLNNQTSHQPLLANLAANHCQKQMTLAA